MSIDTEIARIKQAKTNIATSIKNKGIVVPSNALLSDMGGLIKQISTSTGSLPKSMDVGTTTGGTSPTSSFTISHNLGTIPKAILIWRTPASSATDNAYFVTGLIYISSVDATTIYYNLGTQTITNQAVTVTANNFTVPSSGSTSALWIGTYNWAAIGTF